MTPDFLVVSYMPLLRKTRSTRRSDADLILLITQAVEMKQPEFDKHQIVCDAPAGFELMVAMDQGELIAVLYNLLDNAGYWLRRPPPDREDHYQAP